MSGVTPSRGEVWWASLDPSIGHEQGGDRPVLIVSSDVFNHGPGQMVVTVPLTSRLRRIPLHVIIDPPEGGLTVRSAIRCDQVRAISVRRLRRRLGTVNAETMRDVEVRLRTLLQFSTAP